MSTLSFQVALDGPHFNPSQIPNELVGAIAASAERGQLNKRGNRSDVGWVRIDVESVEEAVSATRKVRALQPGGIERADCVVSYVFDAQCNLEFSDAEVSALAAEGMALQISCRPKV